MEDPIERVQEVHKRMGKLKHSRQSLVALGILAGMGIAPEFIKETEEIITGENIRIPDNMTLLEYILSLPDDEDDE